MDIAIDTLEVLNTKWWCGVSIDTLEEGTEPVLPTSTRQASIVAFENPRLRIFAMHCRYVCDTDVVLKFER